ncbi:glycosyltransferase [Lyngbya aestuarii]|uniref:glycosyltransferase n=1 Tax=Lyngbya aestuarii TaxID=118322 RepID=UPI00403DC149
MNSNPLVSILINNYNYARFLPEAIDSALNQTYSNIEVIVVDDGSTDDSRKIIKTYGDKIVPILKQNGGQASAFNAGFAASKGEIICFLDSDDIFKPGKVTDIVNIFAENQDAGWCFHALEFVGNNSQKFVPETYNGVSGKYDIRSDIQRGKLNGKLPLAGTATSGVCLKRSLLQLILPMPEIIKITSDDYIKYTALGINQGYIKLEALALQRIHDSNAYTLRNDKQKLRAKIQVLTAYWMKANFPSLSTFTNNIFAAGMSIYWRNGGIESECQKLVKNYLSSTTFLEMFEIYVRAFYYLLKP